MYFGNYVEEPTTPGISLHPSTGLKVNDDNKLKQKEKKNLSDYNMALNLSLPGVTDVCFQQIISTDVLIHSKHNKKTTGRY